MIYQLNQALTAVKGIGESLSQQLAQYNLHSVLDLLLKLPLRYEDRSQITTVEQLLKEEQSSVAQSASGKQQQRLASGEKIDQRFVTLLGQIHNFRQYRKGRLLISRAVIDDGSGQLPIIWFNNKFIKAKLHAQQAYYISGEFKKGSLVQASVEAASADQLHTARLVPVYSHIGHIKQGNLRRLQKEILDHPATTWQKQAQLLSDLHFPQVIQNIIDAREQLALEEILYLINKSKQLKHIWQDNNQAPAITVQQPLIPADLPFQLTHSQETALTEIVADLGQTQAMNRLLVGDVGSGKTVVAGLAALQVCHQGHNVAFIAPTQILAQQHYQTLQQLFPQLKLQLVTAQTRKQWQLDQATCYVGTHALINQLDQLQAGLVIYDEQHRFGTKQRLGHHSHLLTMTATPIPRSLMLTIFSHLQVSYLKEMPKQRRMATTWLINKHKEAAALNWLFEQLSQNPDKQALLVCPFIDPSSYQALENVAAVKDVAVNTEQALAKFYQQQPAALSKSGPITIGLLHSRLSKKQQQTVIKQLYQGEIQLLITTPMVEVGVDLPNADMIIIQAAERFGLASLHQLRGRVGRAGQDSWCLLFTSHDQLATKSQQRLQLFCQEKDGFKLAEADLQQRGAGEIFGSAQSGLQQLQFASWTNLDIIQQAKKISDQQTSYQSWLTPYFSKQELLPDINRN